MTLFSCAGQVEVITPSSSFILPEAKGKFASMDANLTHKNGSLLSININETNGNESYDLQQSTIAYGGVIDFGVSKYIDFFTSIASHSPHLYGVKVQVKGDPESQAEKRNLSVAIQMAVGQSNYSGNDNTNFKVSGSSADYSLNRTHTTTRLGLGIGYRIDSYLLSYINLYELYENVHGQIKYDGSPANGNKIDLSGEHKQITLGTLYSFKDLRLGAEYAYQMMNWKSKAKENITSFNFLLGKNF